MDQSFFNRILHLVNARPQKGRRMIGLGAPALWELWQRVSERVQAAQQRRMNDPGTSDGWGTRNRISENRRGDKKRHA